MQHLDQAKQMLAATVNDQASRHRAMALAELLLAKHGGSNQPFPCAANWVAQFYPNVAATVPAAKTTINHLRSAGIIITKVQGGANKANLYRFGDAVLGLSPYKINLSKVTPFQGGNSDDLKLGFGDQSTDAVTRLPTRPTAKSGIKPAPELVEADRVVVRRLGCGRDAVAPMAAKVGTRAEREALTRRIRSIARSEQDDETIRATIQVTAQKRLAEIAIDYASRQVPLSPEARTITASQMPDYDLLPISSPSSASPLRSRTYDPIVIAPEAIAALPEAVPSHDYSHGSHQAVPVIVSEIAQAIVADTVPGARSRGRLITQPQHVLPAVQQVSGEPWHAHRIVHPDAGRRAPAKGPEPAPVAGIKLSREMLLGSSCKVEPVLKAVPRPSKPSKPPPQPYPPCR